MNDDFYRQFEDRFRGSREAILERLAAYAPLLAALSHDAWSRTALDLGCGRGEWLEFVSRHGFAARGVDIDDGMLAACEEHGLSAERLDALDMLRAQPSTSLTVVSGFHFIEHVPFEYALEVFAEALRVLEPGGVLILETPNPENLLVGSELFYLDPSHRHPLPRALAMFAADFAGFDRVTVLGLHGADQADGRTLASVLGGVSLDYAVIAQKGGPADLVALLDTSFDRPFRASLGSLVGNYDESHHERDTRVNHLDHAVAKAIASIEHLEQATARTEHLEEATARIQHLEQAAERMASLLEQFGHDVEGLRLNLSVAESRAAQAESALDDMWQSRSWRLTKPLRAVARLVRRESNDPSAPLIPLPPAPRAVIQTVPLTPRGQQIYDGLSADLGDAADR